MCSVSSVSLSLGLVGSPGLIHSVFICGGPEVGQEAGISLNFERLLALREPIEGGYGGQVLAHGLDLLCLRYRSMEAEWAEARGGR